MKGIFPLTRRQKYYISSLVIQIFLSAFFVYHWDHFVFAESVKDFLHGITPYNLATDPAPLYTYHDHAYPWWYAYPPLPLLMMTLSYGPVYLIFGSNPVAERIFIALPFIVGNLLCAHLIYRLIAGTSSRESASIAEKLILFNPFLILIAAMRGMFDIWIVVFLLMGLLSLRQQRYHRSAIFFGMGMLMKPIMAVFLPILAVYVWNKSGRGVITARFLGLTALTFLVVCLPFFLMDPDGFAYQVAGIHLARPPAGYTLPGLLHSANNSIYMNAITSSVSSLCSFILVVGILLIAAYLRLKRINRESGLVASLLLAILLFTFFNKVVNPQYFVIPIALTVLLLYGYKSYEWFTAVDLRRYYKWMMIPFVASTLIYDGLYYGLLPHDIAMDLLGKTGAQLDLQIVNSLPFSPGLYYLLLGIVGGVLVAPAITICVFMIYKAFKMILPDVLDHIYTSLAYRWSTIRRATMMIGINTSMAGMILIIPFVAGWASFRHAAANEAIPPAPLEAKTVGVFYDYWWHNSTHDPRIQSDNWLSSKLTPSEGYYDLGPVYMEEDIELMKQAGIDFAIVSYGNIFPKKYSMFVSACEEQSFYFTPMVELYDFAIDEPSQDDNNATLDEEAKREIISRIEGVLAERDSPCYLYYQDKPVIFIHATPYFPYVNNLQEQKVFWSEIKTEIEAAYGELFWITNTDFSDFTSPVYDPESLFILPSQVPLHTLEGEAAVEAWRSRSEYILEQSNVLQITTVFPYYDDFEVEIDLRQSDPLVVSGKSSVYDTFWQVAIDNDPDMVIIYSWNQYFEGACIEPTAEFGDMFIKQTGIWIDKFKTGQI